MYANMAMDLQKRWKAKVKVSNLDTARMTLCPYLKLAAALRSSGGRSGSAGASPPSPAAPSATALSSSEDIKPLPPAAVVSDFEAEREEIERLARIVLQDGKSQGDEASNIKRTSSSGGSTNIKMHAASAPPPSVSVNRAKSAGCLWVTVCGHFRSFLFNAWNLKSFFELANTNMHCVYFSVVVRSDAEAPGKVWWGNRGAEKMNQLFDVTVWLQRIQNAVFSNTNFFYVVVDLENPTVRSQDGEHVSYLVAKRLRKFHDTFAHVLAKMTVTGGTGTPRAGRSAEDSTKTRQNQNEVDPAHHDDLQEDRSFPDLYQQTHLITNGKKSFYILGENADSRQEKLRLKVFDTVKQEYESFVKLQKGADNYNHYLRTGDENSRVLHRRNADGSRTVRKDRSVGGAGAGQSQSSSGGDHYDGTVEDLAGDPLLFPTDTPFEHSLERWLPGPFPPDWPVSASRTFGDSSVEHVFLRTRPDLVYDSQIDWGQVFLAAQVTRRKWFLQRAQQLEQLQDEAEERHAVAESSGSGTAASSTGATSSLTAEAAAGLKADLESPRALQTGLRALLRKRLQSFHPNVLLGWVALHQEAALTMNDPNEIFYFGTEALMDIANSICLDHGAFNGRWPLVIVPNTLLGIIPGRKMSLVAPGDETATGSMLSKHKQGSTSTFIAAPTLSSLSKKTEIRTSSAVGGTTSSASANGAKILSATEREEAEFFQRHKIEADENMPKMGLELIGLWNAAKGAMETKMQSAEDDFYQSDLVAKLLEYAVPATSSDGTRKVSALQKLLQEEKRQARSQNQATSPSNVVHSDVMKSGQLLLTAVRRFFQKFFAIGAVYMLPGTQSGVQNRVRLSCARLLNGNHQCAVGCMIPGQAQASGASNLSHNFGLFYDLIQTTQPSSGSRDQHHEEAHYKYKFEFPLVDVTIGSTMWTRQKEPMGNPANGNVFQLVG
ncbi:unnamed protein product [Amoebophrya sp. A120]|nr:unnamed protein product [Amoebophrya sp. A120]|eukprot:GSA120T00020546001.1